MIDSMSSSGLPENVRAALDNLSGEELLAARRYLEQALEARGLDPFGHLDEQDELGDEERARLHAAIKRGADEMKAGKGIPAEQVLAELRQRR